MTSSLEQARRRQRLNQRIRELIAMRRAVGRPASHAPPDPAAETTKPTSGAAAA
jgi:hypothetical protein